MAGAMRGKRGDREVSSVQERRSPPSSLFRKEHFL
jgi:hypothetical protein